MKKDLIILAADKDMKCTLDALLKRNEALGIRKISFDVFVDTNHDPSCCREGVAWLSNYRTRYEHALLMFDYKGCGFELEKTHDKLENDLNSQFSESVWNENGRAVIIVPELENWIWSASPHLPDVIGWTKQQNLLDWLRETGKLNTGAIKPSEPKNAFMAALNETQMPKSSSLFTDIAEKVSFKRCVDPAFLKLKEILRNWFPTNGGFSLQP